MKIRNQTDFWGGMMFVVVGFLFAIVAFGVKFGDTTLLAGYSMGTPARMGPAFFPFWLGALLMVLGGVIVLSALRVDGPKLERFHWGPVLWVLGAVTVFGFLMKPIGMVLAGLVLVIVSSFGSEDFRWKPTIVLAIILVIFSALTFVYGLKLPIPLCPDLEWFQTVQACRV
jgi:hypothetical protein